ncbi:MAG: DUF6056 family protein [Lachnospiraceae bacterium]|nr:DUF6056 family protein [Lachnospiraceae bacterium]
MKKRTVCFILIFILIVSLIPVYYVGTFAHPSVDDYYYGVETAAVWQETHSVRAVLSESFGLMRLTYQEWQGNFSAIFLMRLQPAIFGEQYYVLAPVLLITSFAVCMLLIFYVLLRRWFRSGPFAALGTAAAVTFAAMQFTYQPSDSFYWYNGSVYYTFFFSLMLLLFALILILLTTVRIWVKAVCFAVSLPLAFFIGGGNYTTALFAAVILVLFTLWYLVRRKKAGVLLLLITAALLAALCLSIAAPGNEIREASVGGSTGVVRALLYSLAYGGYNIANSTSFPVIVLWIALLPVFYRIAAHSGFSYRHPVLMVLFTFCIYCSQGTAVFYAQGLRMPYRMMDIIYFSYFGFMTINLIYIMGWLHRRHGEREGIRHFSEFYENKKRRTAGVAAAMLIFAVGCVGIVSVDESEDGSGQAAFSDLPLSVDALYAVVNGSAAQYDIELCDRAEYLLASEEDDVTVAPLSVTPSPIFHTDITTDAADWKNQHLALYYGKSSIRLSE